MNKFKENRIVKPAWEAIDFFLKGSPETNSNGPHMLDGIDIKRFMIFAVFALLPSAAAAIYYYGMRVILMIMVSYVVGISVEWIFAIVKRDEIHEGIFVTCMIYPLVLPPTLPLWMVAVGIAFGVFFGKEVFGGTGRNIFNPALVGRIFITIAFPYEMASNWANPLVTKGNFFTFDLSTIPDAITAATPLTFLKAGEALDYSIMDLLLGAAPGSMGETFRLGIIIAGIWLIYTKVAAWRTPTFFIGTVFVLSLIGNLVMPETIAAPTYQLLTGGLLYGAFFMATDPVSSPYTKMGKVIYGICLGALTILIRTWSGFTEGVMFSIILMNAFGPLIDSYILDRKYKPLSR
jgi:Na+-transporting NADH:ubiquinone oxidoreductase subunit B/electron transport complex protein RnfD